MDGMIGMSREIKFRIWRAPDEYTKVSWMESWDSLLNYSMSDIFQLDNLDDVLEQFTGLKDANGKEIYIGDIVKSNYKYAQPKISQIIMEDGNSYIDGEDLATGNEMLVSDHVEEIEVIGNVHNNPELLEE